MFASWRPRHRCELRQQLQQRRLQLQACRGGGREGTTPQNARARCTSRQTPGATSTPEPAVRVPPRLPRGVPTAPASTQYHCVTMEGATTHGASTTRRRALTSGCRTQSARLRPAASTAATRRLSVSKRARMSLGRPRVTVFTRPVTLLMYCRPSLMADMTREKGSRGQLWLQLPCK
jgi:hypothetical protein